jgi:hypothetical protein
VTLDQSLFFFSRLMADPVDPLVRRSSDETVDGDLGFARVSHTHVVSHTVVALNARLCLSVSLVAACLLV